MCNTTCITHVERTQPIEPITLHLHKTFVSTFAGTIQHHDRPTRDGDRGTSDSSALKHKMQLLSYVALSLMRPFSRIAPMKCNGESKSLFFAGDV